MPSFVFSIETPYALDLTDEGATEAQFRRRASAVPN